MTVVDDKGMEVIGGAVVPYQPPSQPPATLFRTDDPVELIARATAVANPLAEIVRTQKLFTRIGANDHVHVEAWTLLGNMIGIYGVLDGEPEQVEVFSRHGAKVRGWKAAVNAVTKDGHVVGRAVGFCLRSEDQWRNRDDYQLASMAQTRATSKALRQPLGFVMTLAGFNPTPLEEMPPEPAPRPPPREPQPEGAQNATAAQRKRLTGLAADMVAAEQEQGIEPSDWTAWCVEQMHERYQIRSTAELTRDQAAELIAVFEEQVEVLRLPFG